MTSSSANNSLGLAVKRKTCNHRLLEKGGIELTAHRQHVLNVITASSQALTPKVILTKVRRSHTMDKVTLYRILDLFVAKRIVRRIASLHGQMHYEVVCEDHRPIHSHFVCRECGAMECLEDLSLKELKIKIKQRGKWQDDEIDLKLEGICLECKKKIHSN